MQARPVIDTSRPDAARDAEPPARVVYVDRDPVVVSHVTALEASGEGLAAVLADVTDPAAVLGDPALTGVIDLGRPAAIVLGGTLSDMDADVARATVARYAEALAPGSAVIISCASFADEEVAERIAAVFPGWRNYPPEAVTSFFAAGGLRMVRGRTADVSCWPLLPSGCARACSVLGGVGIRP